MVSQVLNGQKNAKLLLNKHFVSRLARRARESDSLLCVGLDPHPDLLAQPTAAAARDFCLRLISACAPYACAFKPNSAFFEAFGGEGMGALRDVISAVPDSIPVILDAKRGDICSTAEAYERAAFDTLGADALTASPYLGRDSVAPFLNRPERGVFVLCKTSNPGADEFQALPVGSGEPLYLQVARQAQRWSENDNLGLVVGATDPEALEKVRSVAPDMWFLVPGVGAQGGDLEAALTAGLRSDGLGMLVSVSRSLAMATDPAAEARSLRDAINDVRRRLSSRRTAGSDARQIALTLLRAGCVRFGQFTLRSGQRSSFYLDLRRLASHPWALRVVAAAFVRLLRPLEFDRLAAIPYAALPIGTAVALAGDWPLIYPRREKKAHGTRSVIEGEYNPGETVVLLDDLITTGESKFETIQKLESAGLRVRDLVVLVARGQDANEVMAAAGYCLHAAVDLPRLLCEWREMGAVTPEQYSESMVDLE